MTNRNPAQTTFLVIITLIGWFALLAQLYINASKHLSPIPEMIIRYFSYFTIQTNLLVALCYTVILLRPQSWLGKFFSRQQTLAAVTVYIIIVGLIYNSILRFLWNPQGLQKPVDELLHTLLPLLAVFYWLIFVSKNELQWKNVLPWLIYPFAYIVYILIRGSLSGFYPYPFINTAQLGLNKVLANSLGIALAFALVSLALVALGKNMSNNRRL